MKLVGFLFAFLGTAFFAILALIYWLLSQEPVGTVGLTLLVALSALLGFYFTYTEKRLGIGPEDRVDAEISDRAGEMGEFSPHSWWPLPVALSGAVLFIGVIFGWWLMLFGGIGLGLSVVGLVFEHYRGAHAH